VGLGVKVAVGVGVGVGVGGEPQAARSFPRVANPANRKKVRRVSSR
jgi:hypothetical protein